MAVARWLAAVLYTSKIILTTGDVTAALNTVVSLTRDNARAIYVADSFMYTRHMCNESTVGGALEILV